MNLAVFNVFRYSLSLATMEQGRFLLAGQELQKEEELEMKNKAEASAGRIRKENVTATAVEKRRRMREKYDMSDKIISLQYVT